MTQSTYDPELLKKNLQELESLTVRMVKAISKKRESDPSLQGPSLDLYAKAAAAYYSEMMAKPERMIEQQVQFWRKSLENFSHAQQKLADSDKTEQAKPSDKRFKNPLWDSNPYFSFIRDQYILSSDTIQEAVDNLGDIGSHEKQRVQFFTRQMVDMFSPSNFFGTNPDALEKAMETNGQSLVDGLSNFVRDLESNEGELAVTLADPNAFEVGTKYCNDPRRSGISQPDV